jgi:hypothetical protein
MVPSLASLVILDIAKIAAFPALLQAWKTRLQTDMGKSNVRLLHYVSYAYAAMQERQPYEKPAYAAPASGNPCFMPACATKQSQHASYLDRRRPVPYCVGPDITPLLMRTGKNLDTPQTRQRSGSMNDAAIQ